MPIPVITRAEFREALRERLGPTASSAPFWSDTELHTAIHETLRLWNLLTGYWSARVIVPTTNAAFVTLPATIVAPTHAFWRGTQLDQASLFELDQAVPTWQSQAASSPASWVPVAGNLMALHPKPSVSSNSLVVDAILATPVLSADADEIELTGTVYEVLLNYARHTALFKLGGLEFEHSKHARKALWEAAAGRNASLTATSLYRHVMGLPADSEHRPLAVGEAAVGIRQ